MANTLPVDKIIFKYEITLNGVYEYKNVNINQITFDESIFKFQPIQSMNLSFPNFESNNPQNFVYNLTNNLPIECDIDIQLTQSEKITGKYYIYDIMINSIEKNKYINMTMNMIHENQIKSIVQMNRQYSYDTNKYTSYTDIFDNYLKLQNIDFDTSYLPQFNNKLVEDSRIVFPKGVNILNIIGQLKSKLSMSEYDIIVLFTTIKNILYFTDIVKLYDNPIDNDVITQIIGKSMQDEQYNIFYNKSKSILYFINEDILININNMRFNNIFIKTIDNIQTKTKNKQNTGIKYYKPINNLNTPSIHEMNIISTNDLYLHLINEMDYMAQNVEYYYRRNRRLANQDELVLNIPNPYMSIDFSQGRIFDIKSNNLQTFKDIVGKYIITRTNYSIDFNNRVFSGKLTLNKIYTR